MHMRKTFILALSIMGVFLLLFCVTQLFPQRKDQTISFVVSAPPTTNVDSVTIELRYAGETILIPLQPDASVGKALQWRSQWKPLAPSLLIPGRILVSRKDAKAPEAIAVFLDPLYAGQNELAWGIEVDDGKLTALRVAYPGTVEHTQRLEMVWVALKILVAIAILILVLWIESRYRGSPQTEDIPLSYPNRPQRIRMAGVDLIIWLLLAAAWTWPALMAHDNAIVGRHYDALGTTWVIDAAPRFLPDFKDTLTSWPTVADYRRLDSFVLLLLSILFRGLSAARLHGWMQILGVATSAWAAQGFARAVGARRPWDMIGGLSFAFSGLAANALLEGYVYHIVCPWLPLFAWVWHRGMSDSGKWHHGLLSGILFGLCLLSSAYLGLAAAVIAGVFFLGSVLQRRKIPWAPTLFAAAIILPLVIALANLYGISEGLSRDMTESTARQASAHLLSIVGATPELDRAQHSLALELSPLVLALVIIAPIILRKRRRYRILMWTAIVGILLAMGPAIAVSDTMLLCRSPLALLLGTPFEVVLRFPFRYGWIWNLCAGALAAIVVTELSQRRVRLTPLLLLVALFHAFFIIGLPARQRTLTWVTPVVYTENTGPLLDLVPVQGSPPLYDEMWFHHLACVYQMDHGQVIAANSVDTTPESQPQVRLGQWTTQALLQGRSQEAKVELAALGFRTLIFHSDYFLTEDRERIDAALSTFGGLRRVSTNGGLRVIAQPIPPADQTLTRDERVALYDSMLAPMDKDPTGELRVDTLHATPDWPHNSSNGKIALAGAIVYAFIIAGWIFRRRA